MKKVFIPRSTVKRYYELFCNGFLWPLSHITYQGITESETFPTPTFSLHDYKLYEMSNTTFANAAIEEYLNTPRPFWVQDYHFLLMPNKIKDMLKGMGHKTQIAHFMHIPFFSWDALKHIEEAPSENGNGGYRSGVKNIVRGMLGNDLLGFHIPDYVDNFLDVVEHVLWSEARMGEEGEYRTVELGGHRTFIREFPIGVDTGMILDAVRPENELTHEYPVDIKELMEKRKKDGVKVYCGLERADYTKGIVERLGIIEELLKTGERLQYIGFSTPSRMSAPGYKELNRKIDEKVGSINSTHSGRLGFEPVIQSKRGIYRPDNFLLMRDADVVMVTSLEDGMNLVVPESILSKKYLPPGERGPVVIGRCGASHTLRSFDEKDGLVRLDPLNLEDSVRTLSGISGANVSDSLIKAVEEKMDVSRWREANMQALYEVTS
jgi:trehalose 6-phosphate synthase